MFLFPPVRQNLPTQMSLKCDCKSVPQNCSFAVFTLIFIEMFQVLDLKVLFFWHVFNGTFERFFSFTRGAEEERWNEGSNCTDWFLQITSREYQNGGKKEEFLKVYSRVCSSVLMPRKRRWNDSPLICFRFHCWGAQESIVKVKIQVDIVQQYKTNLIHFSAESWLVQKNIL